MPVEVILQDRRSASWRPGTHSGWPLVRSRLVHEDDDSALFCSVLFSAGQRVCLQRLIAPSSRSSACPEDRWQEKPSETRIRHTWLLLYARPKRRSMSWPTRCIVHRSVGKPSANAPVFYACINSRRRASSSPEGRPRGRRSTVARVQRSPMGMFPKCGASPKSNFTHLSTINGPRRRYQYIDGSEALASANLPCHRSDGSDAAASAGLMRWKYRAAVTAPLGIRLDQPENPSTIFNVLQGSVQTSIYKCLCIAWPLLGNRPWRKRRIDVPGDWGTVRCGARRKEKR
jgi:hypothetical protein